MSRKAGRSPNGSDSDFDDDGVIAPKGGKAHPHPSVPSSSTRANNDAMQILQLTGNMQSPLLTTRRKSVSELLEIMADKGRRAGIVASIMNAGLVLPSSSSSSFQSSNIQHSSDDRPSSTQAIDLMASDSDSELPPPPPALPPIVLVPRPTLLPTTPSTTTSTRATPPAIPLPPLIPLPTTSSACSAAASRSRSCST